jgi:hypothetical protein
MHYSTQDQYQDIEGSEANKCRSLNIYTEMLYEINVKGKVQNLDLLSQNSFSRLI